MRRFDIGDRVRVDIPDTSDPDHQRYHGCTGEITEILEDDAAAYSGDERDSRLFGVEIESEVVEHFRWRDLRPSHE